MANDFPASRSHTPLQQVPAALYPCGPVVRVSLDLRGRASSARAREGAQLVLASGEVWISTPTGPCPGDAALRSLPNPHRPWVTDREVWAGAI